VDAYLEETCAQFIWVEAFKGASADGRASPQYAAATRYAARIEPKIGNIQLANGDRLQTTIRIMTPGRVKKEDRVYLVDPASGGKPARIATAEEAPDEEGAFDHTIITA
jgi:hypothetical protein